MRSAERRDKWGERMKKLLLILFTGLSVFWPVSSQAVGTSDSPVIILEQEAITVSGASGDIASGEKLQPEAVTISQGTDYSIMNGEVGDKAIQLLIDIQGPSAPAHYDFQVPGATELRFIGSGDKGVYQLLDQNGDHLTWLGAPWAQDALGRSVETSFSLKDGVLVQHVDLSGEGIEYPVMADPYLWIDLISSVTVTPDSYYGGKNIKVAVTPWLGAQYAISGGVWSFGTGAEIAQQYGWPEVLEKIQAKYGVSMRAYVTDRPTYRSQWHCHALGAPLIFAHGLLGDPNASWDLEGYRYTTYDVNVWVAHNCNW